MEKGKSVFSYEPQLYRQVGFNGGNISTKYKDGVMIYEVADIFKLATQEGKLVTTFEFIITLN